MSAMAIHCWRSATHSGPTSPANPDNSSKQSWAQQPHDPSLSQSEDSMGESYVDKAREELADSLYNGLEEELALAALQSPWLTPLVNERRPVPPEPPAPEPAAEARPTATIPEIGPRETDLSLTKSLTPAA